MAEVHQVAAALDELGDVVALVGLDDGGHAVLLREVEDRGGEGRVERHLAHEAVLPALGCCTLVLGVEASDGGELALARIDVIGIAT